MFDTAKFTNFPPPEVYCPVLATSLEEVNAVVAEFRVANDRDFLQYRDTSFMSEFNNLGVQGTPKYYSNWDEDTIVVAPTPDQTYTIQLNYILNPAGS